ncbi:GPI-linked NAD(P)(+)--arginine ADP-ribosyltransferase 1 [Hyla sarda]|uniref:GPI-linked NAD(P)(+)--arginine ADP-ribosyltransferase 1 n=1 Tax=Hyla sarda TaxID=327740 RepID=UPI0024C3461E|nr:GPI-linked NAD(P)(+)--arginine ADP-ribosyltransferase 1 [Hyla sarda]
MGTKSAEYYTTTPIIITLIILSTIIQVGGRRVSRRDIFSPKESILDMAPTSFDDQYRGCSDAMEKEIPQLFREEYATNKEFADGWDTATFKWQQDKQRYVNLPKGFRDEYAIALFAYTINGPLHKVFNEAVREAGQSKQYYLRNFNFKVLHFYLTKALQVLDEVDTPACHMVFRGIRGVRFKSESRKPIRFGQFTSSSKNDQNALQFGEDTFFSIRTCYGVNIKNFSFFPGEEEVLIPPFEKFKVTNFTRERDRNVIALQSLEKSSVYNCELVKNRTCRLNWCPYNSASSIPITVETPVVVLVGALLILSQILGQVLHL